jgi:hypothetical protein
MRPDGARQHHVLAENIFLVEIRYRMPIPR